MNQPKETVVYISREIERAMGMLPSDNYRIISGRTPYGEAVKRQYPDFVTMIGAAADGTNDGALGTAELIGHPDTAKIISSLSAQGKRPYIVVFKNTARIEPILRERGWTFINPAADISENMENKISQVRWLGDMESYLPPHRIKAMKAVSWKGRPFVIQWAHGHTGAGTMLIGSEESLKALRDRFPERRARLSEFVAGPSFTVNVVVTPDRIEAGNISYQITGLVPFTDKAFATVGNDWGIVPSLLSASDIGAVGGLVRDLGERARKDLWRGLFGIDFIRDEKTGRLYLIEINARQPASAVFESVLQEAERADGADGLTTFEAHMAALLGHPLAKPIIKVTAGAQIVQRLTESVKSVPTAAVSALEEAGFKTVAYGNTGENEDLLRVQSPQSIMAGHGTLNENGLNILKIMNNQR